jgi:hypothetical protein
MMSEDTGTHFRLTADIDEWLEQAAAFGRNGDYLGAHARARHAEQELERRAPSVPDAVLDDLRVRVELALRRYDSLVTGWQLQNVARHAAFLARERAVIASGQSEQPAPASLARRLRYQRWRAAVANWFKAPFAPRRASHA